MIVKWIFDRVMSGSRLMINGSRFMVNGQLWFRVQGSWFKVHGSWFMALMVHVSRTEKNKKYE